MEREQEEMQFLGFFGIYKESYNLIRSNRKIFTKITLTFILPLSFIFLGQHKILNVLLANIKTNDEGFYHSSAITFNYLITNIETNEDDPLTTKQTYLALFRLVYFTLYSILFLLSTSAVVYTVELIFTARDLTLRSIISIIPKVIWKRLTITFFLFPLAIIAYAATTFLAFILLLFSTSLFFGSITTNIDTTLALFYMFYFLFCIGSVIGFIYILLIWNLTCVVSVLEDSYGLEAVKKSVKLIKGKLLISMEIVFMFYFSLFAIMYVFQWFLEDGFRRSELEMVDRVCYAIFCLLMISMLKLLLMVVVTVIYFVCKSYHREKIDKLELGNQLEVYLLGEFVPLKAKGVQLEKSIVFD